MANSTFTSSVQTPSGTGRQGLHFPFSTINANLAVPQYATVDKATLTVYFKETTNKLGNADIYVEICNNESGATVVELDYGDGVVPKNNPTNYASRTIDIKEYVASGTANAGNVSYSGATGIVVAFQSSLVSRTYNFYIVVSIDYTEHSHSETSKVTKAATCTTDGERTYTCSVCGATRTEKIPATGHSWKSPTYSWSSDGKTCTATRVCNNNSAHTETATATITSAVKTAATCTAKGTTTYTVKFSVSWASTQTKDVQDIPAKGHTEVTIPAVAPTCTTTGLTEGKKCSVCNTIITAQQTVPALGHSYTDVVTQPTETANGYTTHTCKNDSSHSYVDTYTCRATFKDYDGTVLKAETVNQGGTPTAPSNTTREGYKFVGWSPSVGAITNSTVYTAVYEKLPPQITSVTITRSSDLATVTINTPVDAEAKYIISVEVT